MHVIKLINKHVDWGKYEMNKKLQMMMSLFWAVIGELKV